MCTYIHAHFFKLFKRLHAPLVDKQKCPTTAQCQVECAMTAPHTACYTHCRLRKKNVLRPHNAR